jgi:hypothetical protein
MTFSSDSAVLHWLVSSTVLFFLFWSAIAAAIGLGLMVFSKGLFRLLAPLDHYVSTRHGMKPLAMPHDIGQGVRGHRYLWGALFVAGAAYSIYSLLAKFDGPALVLALNLPYPPSLVLWILSSARWCMVAFGAFAVVVGVMLALFPDALARLESRGNRWVSVRQMASGIDSLHLPIDRMVAASPRTAGSVILAGSLFVAANAAMAWSGIR